MLNRINILPVAGLNYVQNPSWAFSKMVLVTLDDMVIDLRDAPGNLKCQYISAEGKVLFQNSFDGTNKVTLIIKTSTSLT